MPETFARTVRSSNMEMQRKPVTRSDQGGSGGSRRVVTIGAPSPSEGLSRALRATYAARIDSLPDDMMQLLGKLDRH